ERYARARDGGEARGELAGHVLGEVQHRDVVDAAAETGRGERRARGRGVVDQEVGERHTVDHAHAAALQAHAGTTGRRRERCQALGRGRQPDLDVAEHQRSSTRASTVTSATSDAATKHRSCAAATASRTAAWSVPAATPMTGASATASTRAGVAASSIVAVAVSA